MYKVTKNGSSSAIPINLTEKQFDEFILPHLSKGTRGPRPKISLFKIFNYILKVLHTGTQWAELVIDKDASGIAELHHTRIYSRFAKWSSDDSFKNVFLFSVVKLQEESLLDLSILHGDGSSTVAKKGGDKIGFNGHKHFKSEKVIAISDRNCNVICPFTIAAGNKNESPLLMNALSELSKVKRFANLLLKGTVVSLDGAYDSFKNRKAILNRVMTPNIPENKRNRKTVKRGRKRIFSKQIYEERFYTIERVFAWEDKFRKLVVRFERISLRHFGFKLLAYTMINLRHFCRT